MHDFARFLLTIALAALSAALTTALPRKAYADAKSCAASHASGQREMKAGRLRLAAELFTACGSDDACPDPIRAECTEFLESVRRTMPTVIFSVIDDAGKDVSNVRVYSTDELLIEQLDGRALEIDPGKHRLRFVLPWGDVLSSDVLIREGEKNRVVEVRLEKNNGAAPAEVPASSPQDPTPEKAPERSSPPVAAYVATGLAVAGLGTFTAFALLGNADKTKLEDCAPGCTPGERERYDTMKRSYLIADIGLGVGAVSAVVATVLFVTSGSSSTEKERVARREKSRPTLSIGTQRGGASLVLGGQF